MKNMLFLIKKNVSFLKDCSIEFSLFDNDKYSAIIKFSELNFLTLPAPRGEECQAMGAHFLSRTKS
jgi:hypothetical protein